MRKNSLRRIVYGGIIAALYIALTLGFAPISFGTLQFRVSEALTVLPFFMPEAVWGLGVGCFVSNLYTGNAFDIVLGTFATVLAAVITCYIGKRQKREFSLKKAWYAPLPAVISNALIVGYTLTFLYVDAVSGAFPIVALQIGAGELAVCYIMGVPLMYFFNKNKFLSGSSRQG